MATPTTRDVLNVFLASPSDVLPERTSAQDVVGRLNKLLGRYLGLHIDLHLWEDIAPGYGDPQTRINPEVDECDLFIGLIWERWGQPTTSYSSGFEEEFERAIARRKATGRPEIWMVFKSPRPEKLDEPGPQLSQVLKFRELQKTSRELHFANVNTGDEWRSALQTWLMEHAFKVSGAAIPRAGEPQAISSPPAPISTGEDSTLASHEASRQNVPEQLLRLSDLVSRVVRSGELEWARDEANLLSEFDIGRLYLLSATWMTRRYTSDFMGTHGVNLLYKHRDRIEAATPELYELLRTFLQDDSDVIPGWFWFRDDFPSGPLETLLYLATTDTSTRLRIRALKLLTEAHIQIPEESWHSLPLSEEDYAVASAALSYLALMGNHNAFPLLEEIGRDTRAWLSIAATEARLCILIRSDPVKAFSDLLSGEMNPSSELIRAFAETATLLTIEVLLEGAGSSETEVRELAVRELARRNALPLELADTLRGDSSVDVRQIALQEIINKRGKVELEKLRAAAAAAAPATRYLSLALLSGKRDVDLDSLILNYYRTLPTEELVAVLRWSAVDGAPAYRVLAIDRYESISNVIRDDIANGFERLRTQWIEDLKSQFGEEGAAQCVLSFEEDNLSEFIRSQFTQSALSGLALHAEPSDLSIGRKYLLNDDREMRLAAAKIVSKFGDSSDVQLLLDISDNSWGELEEVAPAAAIRLSQNPDQLALEMIKAGGAARNKAAFRWLVSRDSPEVRAYFRSLLTDELDSNRLKGIYYLSQRLSKLEVEELLVEYTKKPTYYYNVVTWLDRLLYSPSPLKEMFARKLREQVLP